MWDTGEEGEREEVGWWGVVVGVPGVNNKARQTTECKKRVGVNIHTQGPIGGRRFRSVKVVRAVGNIYIQCMVAFVPHGDEFGFSERWIY